MLTLLISVAGADSVAIALRSVFYYLMKHPPILSKVISEIQQVDAAGKLSSPIKFSETMNYLPYTCACIKEATRIFPSFAIHMPRLAPPEGLELSGYHIPAGYRAGMNAAVVQRDRSVFGPDADEYRPERWLESPEHSFAMERGMLNFGGGTRTCSGKHVSVSIVYALLSDLSLTLELQIALAEMHKLIPEVLRHFDMKMAHNRPWKTRNAGFLKQKDIIVNLTLR